MPPFRGKKKGKTEKREIITEPVRQSLYDILVSNLKAAKRVNFIHRILYLGKHNFVDGDILDAMEKNYKETNTGYCTEPLSMLLLQYSRYFCCIVEGSEEVLHKHLHLLFENEDQNVDNVKLLSAVHHVKGRFCDGMMSYFCRPPERIEEIDADSDLENSMRYVTECCEKMYRFANAFIADQKLKHAENEVGEEDVILPTKQRSRSIVERDPYSIYLPEKKLLDFLTKCKYLSTLKQYHHYYEYIGQSVDYSLKSWPAPKNFVPYDIFDETYNPITDLPAIAVKKTEATSRMALALEEASESIRIDEMK